MTSSQGLRPAKLLRVASLVRSSPLISAAFSFDRNDSKGTKKIFLPTNIPTVFEVRRGASRHVHRAPQAIRCLLDSAQDEPLRWPSPSGPSKPQASNLELRKRRENECHLRLRFPVTASWVSSTIARRPGNLSANMPLILFSL